MSRARGNAIARVGPDGVTRAALAWLEGDGRPTTIVDGSLAILWTNRSAGILLDERNEIEEREGHLAPTDPNHHAGLQRLISGVERDARTFCIPQVEGGGHLLIRGRRIQSGDNLLFGLSMTRTNAPPGYHELDTAFGLTKAEHRVLLAMASGKEADRLTREIGVSIDTIRTHIRNIYAKLDVNSRESLFAKVQPFRF